MSYDEFYARKDAEIKALTKLKNSFFFYALIQTAMTVVYSLIIVSMGLSAIMSTFGITEEGEKLQIVALIFSSTVYFIYATFMIYFLNFLKGASMAMEPVVPRVKIVNYGIIAYLTGIIIDIPVQMLSLVSIGNIFDLTILIANVVAAIVIFIGILLIGIAVWRIGEHYRSSDLKLGAVLMVILGFLGAFILYLSFDDAIKRVRRRAPPPPAPPWL